MSPTFSLNSTTCSRYLGVKVVAPHWVRSVKKHPYQTCFLPQICAFVYPLFALFAIYPACQLGSPSVWTCCFSFHWNSGEYLIWGRWFQKSRQFGVIPNEFWHNSRFLRDFANFAKLVRIHPKISRFLKSATMNCDVKLLLLFCNSPPAKSYWPTLFHRDLCFFQAIPAPGKRQIFPFWGVLAPGGPP